jgi:hypothetical protein
MFKTCSFYHCVMGLHVTGVGLGLWGWRRGVTLVLSVMYESYRINVCKTETKTRRSLKNLADIAKNYFFCKHFRKNRSNLVIFAKI